MLVVRAGMLKVVAGIVAVLVIALGVTGWLLRRSWQDNATLEANAAQLQATLDSQALAYKALEAERARDETIVTDNAEDKQTIVEYRDRVKYEVKTIVKEAPPQDCLNQSLPPALLECLRSDQCGAGTGSETDLPAQDPDPGNQRALIAW